MAFNEYRDIAELKRRIRRVLFFFRSMASYMGARGENSQESVLHLSGRIGAIARAALAPVPDGGMDLESLVLDELLIHTARREQYSISGPGVRLLPGSAGLMSLVVHELATNAVKYGALAQSPAQISIIWTIAERVESPWLHFEWLETGVTMNPGAKREPGFGSELVERLIASELHGLGQMAVLPGGVRCTIEFPLTEDQT